MVVFCFVLFKMKGLGVSVIPLLAGVTEDFKELFKLFKNDSDFKFATFKKVFRERNMYWIFAGKTTEAELREFNEKIMIEVLSYITYQIDHPDICKSLHEENLFKIFAIYLLYAIYYLQPSKTVMKIHITPEDMGILCCYKEDYLVQVCELTKIIDPIYCLVQLYEDNAFHICKFPDEHNPINWHKHDGDKVTQSDESDLIQTLCDEITQTTSGVHEKYLRSRRCLPESILIQSPIESEMAPEDFIKEELSKYKKSLTKAKDGHKKGKIGKKEANAKEREKIKNIKNRRLAIRERAYFGDINLGRKYRIQQQENDESLSDQETKPKVKRRGRGRPKRKKDDVKEISKPKPKRSGKARANMVNGDEVQVVAVKGKRGRKRKIIETEPDDVTMDNEVTVMKMKRGHKKHRSKESKIKKEMMVQEDEVVVIEEKRSRKRHHKRKVKKQVEEMSVIGTKHGRKRRRNIKIENVVLE